MPDALHDAQPNPPRRWAMCCLVMLLAAAAWLRWSAVGESLWVDELHTAWTVAGSPADVLWRAEIGNQSSFYFWLVRGSVALFGMNEFALRLPSLTAGLALLAALYGAVAGWTGSRWAGLLAAALGGVDPRFIFFASEARVYALVQLLVVGQLYLLTRLATDYKRRGEHLLFVAAGAGLFYLHYTTALLLAAELLWLAAMLVIDRRRTALHVLAADFLAVGLACAPAWAHLLQIAGRRQLWRAFVQRGGLADLPAVIAADTHLGPALLIVLCAVAWRRWRSGRWPPGVVGGPLTLLAAVVALPLAAAWLLTWFDIARLLLYRYLIASAVGGLMLTGVLWSRCPSRCLRLALAVFVLACGVRASGLVEYASGQRPFIVRRNEDWRGAVAWLRRQPRKPLLIRSGLIEERNLSGDSSDPRLAAFARLPVTGAYRLDDHLPEIFPFGRSLRLPEEALGSVASSGGAYVLIRDASRAEQTADELASALHARIVQRRAFGNVRAFVLERLEDG